MHQPQTKSFRHQESGEQDSPFGSQGLEAALKRVSKQAVQYEHQMKDLEGKLSENLSNFRALDNLLQEAFVGLQRNSRRTDRAINSQVPHLCNEVAKSMDTLSELSEALPTIQTQVTDIRHVYDTGQQKAQSLVSDLEWLNTYFYERWRAIIFTSSSPVSWSWKALMRALFAMSFVFCVWMTWIALWGAIRAYRQRLVWGERLMS